jgi:hypothetical protein
MHQAGRPSGLVPLGFIVESEAYHETTTVIVVRHSHACAVCQPCGAIFSAD